MSTAGQIGQKTRQRAVKVFCEGLGYDDLSDWTARDGNASIEPWRAGCDALNRAPLGNEHWRY